MTILPQPPFARYGLIIPSSNRMTEPHTASYSPPGLGAHTTRLRMTGDYFMPIKKLVPKVAEAAALLADAKCDPIIFHCTANSMAEGPEGEARIKQAIEDATGVHAATTASATIDALAALGATRIVLASPYTRPSHEHELEFMDAVGIEVVGERNLGFKGSDEYCAVAPETWVSVLDEMKDERADAYFVSCANIRAIEAIPEMEKRLGRPVITSNQLVIWRAARLAGIGGTLPALGRLGSVEAAHPVTA